MYCLTYVKYIHLWISICIQNSNFLQNVYCMWNYRRFQCLNKKLKNNLYSKNCLQTIFLIMTLCKIKERNGLKKKKKTAVENSSRNNESLDFLPVITSSLHSVS